jgi:predicted dehydrogenase
MSLNVRAPFLPDNKYLNTPWRNKPSWYGGLFIDAFVHATAMLRFILGPAQTVSAITSSQADYIPSVDTMAAHMTWENGVQGAVSVTYACTKMKFELEVVGTNGTLNLSRREDGPGYRLTVDTNDGTRTDEDFEFGGLDGEFLAFAAAAKQQAKDRNTPLEALLDLALVEACLLSGQNNGEKRTVES